MNDNKINMMQELTYLLSYRGKLKFLKYIYVRKQIKIKNNRFEYLLSGINDEEILNIFKYLLKEIDFNDKIGLLKYIFKEYIKGIWYKIECFITGV